MCQALSWTLHFHYDQSSQKFDAVRVILLILWMGQLRIPDTTGLAQVGWGWCMPRGRTCPLPALPTRYIVGSNSVLSSPLTDYWWSVDRLVTCSASCGNRGFQQPRLRCLLNHTEVDPERCVGKPRPAVQPIACNRRDCPSR